MSGCDQLVVGLTHVHGGTLDLLKTDVHDLVWVAVATLISNSDHSSLQPPSSLIENFWVPVMHFCACPIHCTRKSESGKEARIMQIDFSTAFNRVNNQGILDKLCGVCIHGFVLSIYQIDHACYGGL